MGTNLFILAGLLVVIVLLGIIGILSRYRKCKSDEVLVVYGKTGGSKSAKLYHGGAAFSLWQSSTSKNTPLIGQAEKELAFPLKSWSMSNLRHNLSSLPKV